MKRSIKMHKKRHKKAQITAFIILGIIILGVAGIVIYVRQLTPVAPEAPQVPLDVQSVQTFVDSCLERVGENALLIVGLQGGHVALPDRYLQTELLTIPYFYYGGERSIIELENVSRQINYYLRLFLPRCLEGFKTFRMQGYEVSSDDITSETIFGEEETIINLNYPLTLRRGDAVLKLANFSTKIAVPYKSLYSIATQIADQQNRSNGMIDSTLLDSFGKNITMLGFENNTVVFLITDDSKIKGSNYQFLFATKVS